MSSYGRDPKRRADPQQRAHLFEDAGGRCQRCGVELGPDYQAAHLIAHSHGGATTLPNLEAWCPSCNLRLGNHDAGPIAGLTLRPWQADALPVIADRVFRHGTATLQAAPGAGKTIFAAVLMRRLLESRLIERIVVVVPNTALVRQWRSELAQLGIHLDPHPTDGALEADGLVGVIVTYQSLPTYARVHATRMRQRTTLLVFDEVHHVADEASWGNAVRRMVGDVAAGEVRAGAVLNMTGTLFRSDPRHRISTVRYERVTVNDVPKLQALNDWAVPTRELIGTELRAPELYRYGGRAEYINLSSSHPVLPTQIADLDERERTALLSQVLESPEWIDRFAAEAVRLLNEQIEALDHAEYLKLLFVAPTVVVARHAARALNKATGTDFARLIVYDEPDALTNLRIARDEPRSCGIVTVRMVTEGFDCPHISVIAYASNIVAPLFVSQMMARAMRLTRTERDTGTHLPAKILIPDHPVIREAFADTIRDAFPLTDETGPEVRGPSPETTRSDRYDLVGIDDPHLRGIDVLDLEQTVSTAENENAISLCETVLIPTTYATRLAVGIRLNGENRDNSD
ncbi:Superfamily II DNA or RNA helicase [Saccharopolyspora kobensis]|uniref:Superfamily II DNA or RNA helicase n=1 Tax=Saccharopolyspora kobensis TaxID=146035 RepID=A0A1H5VRR2_9PSEU|nr:DEAD/DEAH box helicase family protein [Saccharopolyspora kobensis]SEF89658.1 Superfamily II DNA or RNA helicase [Saccharopolyspora kobensis]SFC58077.1 Superfamily II DNA or RNA helicase [Saccharopolyspora kobensis]